MNPADVADRGQRIGYARSRRCDASRTAVVSLECTRRTRSGMVDEAHALMGFHLLAPHDEVFRSALVKTGILIFPRTFTIPPFALGIGELSDGQETTIVLNDVEANGALGRLRRRSNAAKKRERDDCEGPFHVDKYAIASA